MDGEIQHELITNKGLLYPPSADAKCKQTQIKTVEFHSKSY